MLQVKLKYITSPNGDILIFTMPKNVVKPSWWRVEQRVVVDQVGDTIVISEVK